MKLFKKKDEIEPIYNQAGERMSVEEVIENTRYSLFLKRYGIQYVDELVSMTKLEVLRLPYFGKNVADEIEQNLNSYGFYFITKE